MTETGGRREIVITTGPSCAWRAAANAGWVSPGPASGTGPGQVVLVIAANSGSSTRATTVHVGEEEVSVTQSAPAEPACDGLRLAPDSQGAGVDGGSFTATVTSSATCTWNVASDSWIKVSPPSGSGDAALKYTVSENSGSSRTGTIRVGTGSLTLSQAGCSVTVSLPSPQVAATGGVLSASVTATGSACTWTASSSVSWITAGSTSGRGSGQVSFTVAANTGGTRTGRVTVGTQSIEVQQAASPSPSLCPESVTPSSASVRAAGGDVSFGVNAAGDCKWSVSNVPSWITVVTGSGSGSGNGLVRVQPNQGAKRDAKLAVGVKSIAIEQEAATQPALCPELVSPSSASVRAAGDDVSFKVNTAGDCKWSVSNVPSWITVLTGSGTGSGGGSVRVQSNQGAKRDAKLVVGVKSMAIEQAAAEPGCTYTVRAERQTFSAVGGDLALTITTDRGCAWESKIGVTWITPSFVSGSGPSTVTFRILENSTKTQRDTTISVRGASVSVVQSMDPLKSTPVLEK